MKAHQKTDYFDAMREYQSKVKSVKKTDFFINLFDGEEPREFDSIYDAAEDAEDADLTYQFTIHVNEFGQSVMLDLTDLGYRIAIDRKQDQAEYMAEEMEMANHLHGRVL